MQELSEVAAVGQLIPPALAGSATRQSSSTSAGETVIGSLDSLTEEQSNRQINSNLKSNYVSTALFGQQWS